jgi:hypothetical protein
MALPDGRGLIVRVKTDRRAPLALLCLAAVGLASCTFYFPHSLVATNIRTTDKDALTSGSKRVEAEVCGHRVLWIPFGPEPRMTAVMAALQEQVTNAIGFEDIRVDVSFVNYVYPLFWQQCVQASAFPLFAVTGKRPAKPAQKTPAPEEAPAPEGAAPDPGKTADPFAQ